MKLPPYPRYKSSGVEWLGDVPEHWEVKRLKMAAHLTDKKVEADEDGQRFQGWAHALREALTTCRAEDISFTGRWAD